MTKHQQQWRKTAPWFIYFTSPDFDFSAAVKIGSPLFRYCNLSIVKIRTRFSQSSLLNSTYNKQASNFKWEGEQWRSRGEWSHLSQEPQVSTGGHLASWASPVRVHLWTLFPHPHFFSTLPQMPKLPCSDATHTREVTALLREKALLPVFLNWLAWFFVIELHESFRFFRY